MNSTFTQVKSRIRMTVKCEKPLSETWRLAHGASNVFIMTENEHTGVALREIVYSLDSMMHNQCRYRAEEGSILLDLSNASVQIQCTSYIVVPKQLIKACTGRSAWNQDYISNKSYHNASQIISCHRGKVLTSTGAFTKMQLNL